MDHAEALRLRAAERYLLGELEEETREQYEEHFFSCAECSADIRMTIAFASAAREAMQTQQVGSARAWPKWFSWFRPVIAVPALAVLVAVIAYQNLLTIPQMKRSLSQATTPQAMKSLSLITANSRGAAQPRIRVGAGQPFLLLFDIPPEHPQDAYLCRIESESGAAIFSITVSAEQAKETVQILVPGSLLQAGHYTLVVRQGGDVHGTSQSFIGQYPFSVDIGQ